MSLPPAHALEDARARYEQVVERQGVARLAELDRWYHAELPGLIAGRAQPHVALDELVRLTEWKMARGVWRARNLVLVRSNAEVTVREVSGDALALVPHATRPVATLSTLKGIGPATASAVLAAAHPERYPFFDELVAAQLPGLGAVKWTLGYYARYADALRTAAATLGDDWSAAELERALWAFVGGKAGAAA